MATISLDKLFNILLAENKPASCCGHGQKLCKYTRWYNSRSFSRNDIALENSGCPQASCDMCPFAINALKFFTDKVKKDIIAGDEPEAITASIASAICNTSPSCGSCILRVDGSCIKDDENFVELLGNLIKDFSEKHSNC